MKTIEHIYKIPKPEKYPEFKYLSFIRRGPSSTKQALYFIKMKKSPVTSRQIADVFPNYFRKPSDVTRVVKTLEKRGLVQEVSQDCWRITDLGYKSCYVLGKRDAVIASQLLT
jgi:hypothetical protein